MTLSIGGLELQAIKVHKGLVFHAALLGVKLVLRAEVQLTGDGKKIGDFGYAVLIDDGVGDADGVSVVQTNFAQQTQALPLLNSFVDKVIESFSRGVASCPFP